MFWENSSRPARILCGIGLGFVAFVVIFPMLTREHNIGRVASCQSNLKQIGLGLMQYTQDYDEKLPPIASGGSAYGWVDALYPYLKSEQIFVCPQQRSPWKPNPMKGRHTDYPLNARLARQAISKITAPRCQILSLDGNDGTDRTDARYSLSHIPLKWQEDIDSPLYRHKGAANYLFADGHVKSLLPSEVMNVNSVVF